MIEIRYNSLGNWLPILKQRIYVHIFIVQILYIYRKPLQEKEGPQGPKDGQNNGWKKKGQMEVRWLLTNRKHGGKTKSVSVLKAALNNGGMGKNRKTIVND